VRWKAPSLQVDTVKFGLTLRKSLGRDRSGGGPDTAYADRTGWERTKVRRRSAAGVSWFTAAGVVALEAGVLFLVTLMLAVLLKNVPSKVRN